MKAFISGKISGDPNYREKFMKAEADLKGQKYTVFNPACLPGGFDQDTYIDACLLFLAKCDIVVMLPDWKSSPGASNEYRYAKAHGIPVFELAEGNTCS